MQPSLRATGVATSLRGAKRRGNPDGGVLQKNWIASSQRLLAMTAVNVSA
jgi:hypothetical protein